MDTTELNTVRPIALVIVDGWGLSPIWKGNAITMADAPNLNRLWKEYPHAALQAMQPVLAAHSSPIGSSNIGHTMLGAGRAISSDLEDISRAIDEGLFYKNSTLLDAMRSAKISGKKIHLIGLASDVGVHSNLKTLAALLALAQSEAVGQQVKLHLILDGEDSQPRSGSGYVKIIEGLLEHYNTGKIVSAIGRIFGMDRLRKWELTAKACKLWLTGAGTITADFSKSLENTYELGVHDDQMPPFTLGGTESIIDSGDTVIFWNARGDRIQQSVLGLVDPSVLRSRLRRIVPIPKLARLITLVSTDIRPGLPVEIAFPPAVIPANLTEILAGRGLKQLRAAEQAKEMHITYYFNGGRSVPYPGEQRLIVASNYSDILTHPAGATPHLMQAVIAKMQTRAYSFAAINIGNVDIAGHTGDLNATVKAVQAADSAIGALVASMNQLGGITIITSDHGNAERLIAAHSDNERTHTTNPVPFILVDEKRKHNLVKQAISSKPGMLADLVRSRLTLADVAPTILELLEIPIPIEMTGASLLNQLS